MKEKFLKTMKHLFALAFVAFVIAVSLNTTAFAANQKVTNLKQIGASTNNIKISWDAPLGADKFSIYIFLSKRISRKVQPLQIILILQAITSII